MSIVRSARRENPFAQIDKRLLDDEGISWKAKGLLCYLLSKPADWQIQVRDLISKATDGRDAVYSALRELTAAGYIVTEQVLVKGKFDGIAYIVHENRQTQAEKPHTGFPDTEKPHTGKPYPEKPDHTNKESNNIEFTNIENIPGWFLKTFNMLTGKAHRVLPPKAETQLRALFKAGYLKSDIEKTIKTAFHSDFHKGTKWSHLTPEFITRIDKFEKYFNTENNGQSIGNNKQGKAAPRTADSGGKKNYD